MRVEAELKAVQDVMTSLGLEPADAMAVEGWMRPPQQCA